MKVITKLTKVGSEYALVLDEEMLKKLSFQIDSESAEIKTDGESIFITPIKQTAVDDKPSSS